MKLNKSTIDRLPIPTDKPVMYRDDELRGFGLKVYTTGAKSFFLEKKIHGRTKRLTIGRYGELTAEQARKEAVKLAGKIAKGDDPVAERQRQKLEGKTLREAFEDYIKRRTLKPQTLFDINRCMNEVYPDWLKKPLTRITPDMVVRRHQKYGEERSKARANLAMRYLRAVFNFAMAEYTDTDGKPIISANPVGKLSQTKSWYRVTRRQSVIKAHELGAWMNAVLELRNQDHRDYFLTVLLTGLRRNEALNLTWRDVDLAAKTLTCRDTKNHRDHTLPLSDYLVDILNRRQANAVSDYVFADSQGRRISNFRYAQAAITKASGIEFCIHDLRRTFATIAESLDIPAYALKRLLNHADGADVTAGYIVANVERLREPMQKITDYILKTAGLKVSAEIVEFSKRQISKCQK